MNCFKYNLFKEELENDLPPTEEPLGKVDERRLSENLQNPGPLSFGSED